MPEKHANLLGQSPSVSQSGAGRPSRGTENKGDTIPKCSKFL